MSNVDDIFKKPNGPSTLSTGKRKLEIPDGDAVYKAAKLAANTDAKSGGLASVVDEDDDIEAGPEPPPDEDDDTDEEGRFFGGGVGRDTQEAIDYLDTADAETKFVDERIDAAWARRLVTNLERKISKNAEQRARFEKDPARFMQSEAELDAEIKHLSNLTEHGQFYADFAKAGGAEHLVALLAHDNTDIAINAIEIIAELLDEDVEIEQEQWDVLANSLLKADLATLLAQNFERLDEAGNQSDAQGVYHSLAVLEALASQVRSAERAGSEAVIRFLLGRAQAKEAEVSQNKQYAVEVLQVLLQESTKLRRRVITLGGMEVLLRLLSAYRRDKFDASSLEEEYVLNLFNTLVCLVQEDEGQTVFIEEEGVELMLIMVKEGKLSRAEALKVLDHATQRNGQAVCAQIVEAAGLKALFGLFKKKLPQQMFENLIDILAALLRFLPGDSPERIRTLAKFAEKDYDKVQIIVGHRQALSAGLGKVDSSISQERKAASTEEREERTDEWFLRRLDAGLHTLQTVNVVLAWLVAEDRAGRDAVATALDKHRQSLQDVKDTLRTQLSGVDREADEDYADMLDALIATM